MTQRFSIRWPLLLLPIAVIAVGSIQWVMAAHPRVSSIVNEGLRVMNDAGAGPQFNPQSLVRRHLLCLQLDGSLEGRLLQSGKLELGVSGARVRLIQNQKVMHATLTDSDGVFRIENVSEGNYTVLATGEGCLTMLGVDIVTSNEGTPENYLHVPVCGRGATTIEQLLAAYAPLKQEKKQTIAELAPEVISGNRVLLDRQRLQGQVHGSWLPVEGDDRVQVFLFQGEREAAHVEADSHGRFAIDLVEPGVYTFVAAGSLGSAVVSVELLQEAVANEAGSPTNEIAAQNVSFAQPVVSDAKKGTSVEPLDSLRNATLLREIRDLGASRTFHVQLAPPGDEQLLGEKRDELETTQIEYSSESIVMGGACGGSCGSCSNFSGFEGTPELRPRLAPIGCGGPGYNRINRLIFIGGPIVGIVATGRPSNNPTPTGNPPGIPDPTRGPVGNPRTASNSSPR